MCLSLTATWSCSSELLLHNARHAFSFIYTRGEYQPGSAANLYVSTHQFCILKGGRKNADIRADVPGAPASDLNAASDVSSFTIVSNGLNRSKSSNVLTIFTLLVELEHKNVSRLSLPANRFRQNPAQHTSQLTFSQTPQLAVQQTLYETGLPPPQQVSGSGPSPSERA